VRYKKKNKKKKTEVAVTFIFPPHFGAITFFTATKRKHKVTTTTLPSPFAL
jgi:hypothetical protein